MMSFYILAATSGRLGDEGGGLTRLAKVARASADLRGTEALKSLETGHLARKRARPRSMSGASQRLEPPLPMALGGRSGSDVPSIGPGTGQRADAPNEARRVIRR